MKDVEIIGDSRNPKNMAVAVARSFRYAFDGLIHVLITQRNMRFHFAMALWVMAFAVVLKVSAFEKSFLMMIITFVFAMEILNTCIENLTNLLSPGYSESARIAKDTAAAAVLVVSIGSVMAAGYLLIGPFFKCILNPAFWAAEHNKMICVVAIVLAVLLFWLSRGLEFSLYISIIPTTAVSGFAISHLGLSGGDWLALCSMMFFSFLLYNSITRSKTSVIPPAFGHMLGIAVYLLVRMYH